jgi:hypothetical protein
LIPPAHHGLGRLAAHVLGARIVGKALAQIDRLVLARELRHHLEHGNGKLGKHRVHAGTLAPQRLVAST